MSELDKKPSTNVEKMRTFLGCAGVLALLALLMVVIVKVTQTLERFMEKHLPNLPPFLMELQTEFLPWLPLILVSIGLSGLILLWCINDNVSHLSNTLGAAREDASRVRSEISSLRTDVQELNRTLREGSIRATKSDKTT